MSERVASRPFTWLAALWLAAYVTLLAAGRSDEAWAAPATLAGVLLFAWLVCRITPGPAPMPTSAPGAQPAESRAKLSAQLVWLAVVIALTAWRGLVFNGVVQGRIPLWDDVLQALAALGERWLSVAWVGGPRNALANPSAYFVLPLAGLLLLGARFRSLGFGPGQRVLAVSALVCALPVGWIALRASSLQQVAGALLGNTLQNGPFEEFLFRGALQTRLVPLVGRRWAVGLQALAFGLWHIGMAAQGGESLWLAAAHTIVAQATTGFLFGIVFQRTGNLWACSLLHVLSNTAAQVG